MVEVIVGLVIIVFTIAGFRDGLAKALGSIVMLFLALFISSAAVNALARTSAEFSNPKSILTVIVFFIIWLVVFGALDLLTRLILKVVVNVTVLGPLDHVAGLLLGAVRGMLICGIFLRLILSFPLSDGARRSIIEAIPAKFSIAAFEWAYPEAKKLQPYFDNLIKNETKTSVIDEIAAGTKVSGEVTSEIEKAVKDNVPPHPLG